MSCLPGLRGESLTWERGESFPVGGVSRQPGRKGESLTWSEG